MKIKLTQTGEITEVSALYGERLIEQGKALPAGTEPEPDKADKPAANEPPEDSGEPAEGANPEPAKKPGKKR